MWLGHAGMVWSRVCADLGRLTRASWARWVGDRRVDLGRGRTAGRRSTDSALAGSRASGAGRRLVGEATGSWTLRVLRLEGRCLGLRRRRRRALEPWRRLWHLVRRSRLLLRRRWRRNGAALATLTGHDGAEGIRAHANSRRGSLGRASMGRRTDHGALRSASTSLLQLSAQVSDLFFEPSRERRNLC